MNSAINGDPDDPQPTSSFSSQSVEPAASGVIEREPAKPVARSDHGDLFWMILGPDGLRAGWSILLFVVLLYFFATVIETLISSIVRGVFHLQAAGETAGSSITGEGAWVLALAVTLAILSRIEHRRFADYYLAGPAAVARLVSGLVSGFAALSALIAMLVWGGWIRFAPAAHPDATLLRYAALWAIAFLFVGLTEEGIFRCYLLSTLARRTSFWWAVAAVAGMCVWDVVHPASHGAGGVYVMAALGVLPCLYLHVREAPRRGFWQAAWVTSTLFGFIHTGNNGETWIGIFAAGAIGLVLCVSVRLTGSAWWAIGYHAAWDWAETYFYGTADSGFVARGHLFTTTPAGSALWSGGSDGPEGSLLVLPVILLLLGALLLMYGRKRHAEAGAALAQSAAS